MKSYFKLNLQRINTTQVIAVGFAGVILMGSLLLMLPISWADGQSTDFVDALFTATTSVCVTGLTTVSTAGHWSIFGKIIILILIQLGGLGVITCISILLIMLGKKVTLVERRMIRDSYGLDTMEGMVKFVRKVVKGTFIIEGIGAVIYSFIFIPKFGTVEGICKAVFLSVSAFCNAGMDILGDSSLAGYSSNVLINITTMLLIVFGGIGFTVWWDIIKIIREKRTKNISLKRMFYRLSLHSQLAILITLALIFTGALFIFIFEYKNPDTIGNMSVGNKIMASFFESVTLRTAGFYTFSQEKLTNASVIMAYALMFIGGSPAGTAGGMKTTTVGMLVLTTISTAKSRKDTEIFNRKISKDNVRMGLAVIMMGIMVVFASSMLMCVLMPDIAVSDILFEMISAVATVGLSRNVTGYLTDIAKIVVILVMYLGRIGPITIVIALAMRNGKQKKGDIDLPEKKIIVG